ncbi:MAG: hypothetical protein LUE27_06330 [Clostridia bacterium]|nr:hypothetical protein [Clostridia bacterium]
MKKYDMRFSEDVCRQMVGKVFSKYRCDPFEFTNSVTQIVGLYISDQVYSLTNIQEVVDYFGYRDDIGVFKLSSCQDSLIHSAFHDVTQIDNPVTGEIKEIKLVNECQRISRHAEALYEVWLTRAIIFCTDEREFMFEKDMVTFSEEIIIRKGYDLLDTISPNNFFMEEWDEDGVVPEYTRVISVIK